MEAITIGTTWLQSVSLLYRTYTVSSPSYSWPSLLSSPIVAFIVENIFLLSVEDLQKLPWDTVTQYLQYLRFGFRSNYIMINLIFPLALCLLASALFKPLPTLISYTSFLVAVCLFSSFVYIILLQRVSFSQLQHLKSINTLANSYLNEWYFLTGAILFFTISLIFFIMSLLEWRFQLWARVPRMGALMDRFVHMVKEQWKELLDSRGYGASAVSNEPHWRTTMKQNNKKGRHSEEDVHRVTVKPSVTFARTSPESTHTPKTPSGAPRVSSSAVTPFTPSSPSSDARVTTVPMREQHETILPKNHKKGYIVTKVHKMYDEFDVTTYKEQPINELKEQRRLAHRFNCYKILFALIVILLALALGLALIVALRQYVTGSVTLAVALAVLLFYVPLLLVRRGRALLFWVRYQVLEKWAVFLLLILVQILYTPFMTAIFDSFACDSRTCPEGTRFVSLYNGISLDTIYKKNSEGVYCEPCMFYSPLTLNNSISLSNANNATCAFISEICPQVSRNRLLEDPALDCRMDMMTYFWPASILTGVLYAVALPVLYFLLVQRSLSILKRMDVNSLLWKNLPDHIKQEARKLTFRNFVKHEIKKVLTFFREKITRKKVTQKSQIGLWAPELQSKLKKSRSSMGSFFQSGNSRSKAVVVPNSDADIDVSGRKKKDGAEKQLLDAAGSRTRKHSKPPLHVDVADIELLEIPPQRKRSSSVSATSQKKDPTEKISLTIEYREDAGNKSPRTTRKRSSSTSRNPPRSTVSDASTARSRSSTSKKSASSSTSSKATKTLTVDATGSRSRRRSIPSNSKSPKSPTKSRHLKVGIAPPKLLIQTSAGAIVAPSGGKSFKDASKIEIEMLSINKEKNRSKRKRNATETSSRIEAAKSAFKQRHGFSGSTRTALLKKNSFHRTSFLGDLYESLAEKAKKSNPKTGQIPLVTPSGIVYVDDPNASRTISKEKHRSLFYRLFCGCLALVFGWGYNEKREVWQIRINLSTNPVRALYYSFHYNARFFKIWILFYKLLLVAITISLFNHPVIVLSIVSFLHIVLLGFLALSRPYIFSLETMLHVAATAICVLDTLYVLFMVLLDIPEWLLYVVLAINAIFFFVVFLVLFLSCITRLKFTWKYQQLFRKTRKFQKHITKMDDEDNLADNHANVNYKLTRTNLNIVVNFLMIMGFTLVVALFLCVLSMFRHEFLTDHFPSLQRSILAAGGSHKCSDMQHFEFVGYESWSDFASNCCCSKASYFENSIHEERYPSVEFWSCRNGESKERIRQELRNDNLLSGEGIREFCSREFASGYSVDQCGVLRFDASAAGNTSKAGAYAEQYLW